MADDDHSPPDRASDDIPDPIPFGPALTARLAQALEPLEPTADERARMRRSLLRRARGAADADGTITVPPGTGRWAPYQPGIEARVIYNGSDSTSLLLRMQPGSVLAEHDHPGTEECIVLEGEVALGDRLMTAGTFHVAPKGVHHMPITARTGALLYLRLARG